MIVVAFVAVALGAVLKSISGVGLPLVTIPAIAYVADIETAVAFTALPNLVQNAELARAERASRSATRDLPVLAFTGFVGGVAGTLLLVSVPEEPLIAVLVVVVLAYAVRFATRPSFRVTPSQARRFAPLVGLSAGAMQGAVGISGPIVASWIHSYRLERSAHVLSVTSLFAVAGLAQLPTLALSGRLADIWAWSLLSCVLSLATIPLGAHLRGRLSNDGFDRFVVVTLVASVIGLALRTFA